MNRAAHATSPTCTLLFEMAPCRLGPVPVGAVIDDGIGAGPEDRLPFAVAVHHPNYRCAVRFSDLDLSVKARSTQYRQPARATFGDRC